jgi:hypothetical protein
MASVLAVGKPFLHLNRREPMSIFQSNRSETFTPPETQRWTISIDVQIQPSTLAPTCTLQICLEITPEVCGSKRAISDTWSTFSFVARIKANEPQTVIFITSCSEPARIALRSIVTPDHVLSGTSTALLGIASSTFTTNAIATSSSVSPSISNSPSTSVPAMQPTPLPQDPASTRIRAINLCEYNRPILVSVPENPDYMLITESGVTYDLGLEYGNEGLRFTPLNGQALCPKVSRTGPGPAVSTVECSRDALTYAALPGDMITLDCASGPGPVPDLFNAADTGIQTSGSCPAIIRQLGCQAAGAMCLLDVYEGTVDSYFKFLSGPLRFKAIGEGWTRASLQVTANGRATVSYMQERGSFVSIDQDLLVGGTVIQIECDVPLQPKVFSVDVLNTCTRQPYIQVGSLTFVRPEPGAAAQVLVSSDNKFAQISWGGFNADHTVCVTRRHTATRRCGTDSVTTNDLGELDVGDTLGLECPINTVYAKVVNSCPVDNPAIFGVSREADWVILRAGDSFDFNVPAEDASATFIPLGGYRMCALSGLGTANACGTETIQLTGIVDQDVVQLNYPGTPPAPADMSRTIPLSIYTGPSCPNLLVQIGCEGHYCQGLAYLEGSKNVALAYPMLSPAARLQIRILRSIYSSVKWTVTFGGDPTFLDQANSQWLEIAVPDDATQIALRTSCTLEAAVFYVGVVSDCPGSFVVVKTLAQAPVTLQAYTGTYFAAYTDFPRLSFEAMDGRVVCAHSAYRPGITQCGTSFSVDADGTTGWDQFDLRCD